MRRLSLALLLSAGLTSGCEDTSYRDVGAEIRLLSKRDDAFVPPAIQRLGAFGGRAIPQIETALHTASPTAKRHLLAALVATGDAEAVPVLRHFALYDVAAEVRQQCHARLTEWARVEGPLGAAAGAAVAWVAERRGRGEGPMIAAGGPK